MDVTRLYKILAETTCQLRKGEEITGTPELVEEFKNLKPGDELKGGGVLEIFAMPSVSEAPVELVQVDLHFVSIGVDKAKAEQRRAEFVSILKSWPNDALAGGPSYITVGGEIGDQGSALQMFALGQVLGLWTVITPKTVGIEGEDADRMAGMGFVMMSGFRPDQLAA